MCAPDLNHLLGEIDFDDNLYLPYSLYQKDHKEEWLREQNHILPFRNFVFVKRTKGLSYKLFKLNEKGELESLWKTKTN